MECKNFKYAAIFKEEDVREDLISCAVACTEEFGEAVIMSEDEQGEITPVAEVKQGYSRRELTILADGWIPNGQMLEAMFNLTELIWSEPANTHEQCANLAKTIVETYNISVK